MKTEDSIVYSLSGQKYTIVVGNGILEQISDWFEEIFPNRPCVIVGEHNARPYIPYHLSNFVEVIEGGENCKSWNVLQNLCERLLPHVDRSTVLIAVGGGALGDMVGLMASLLLRGIDWALIPTTLLAQVDSSIGGKTAINSAHGKNLIGSFHPPKLVISDTKTLETLSKRQYLAGYVELFKHAVIADPFLFETLEKNPFENLDQSVKQSIALKLKIIGDDFLENKPEGTRCWLNLGHTLGHSLEHMGELSLLHGEAIAIGINFAYELAVKVGLCHPLGQQYVQDHLNRLGLKTSLKTIFSKDFLPILINKLTFDKKKKGDYIHFILPRGIGVGCEIYPIALNDLSSIMMLSS